jgi:hypothetical protein
VSDEDESYSHEYFSSRAAEMGLYPGMPKDEMDRLIADHETRTHPESAPSRRPKAKRTFAVVELHDGLDVGEGRYGPQEKCDLCGRELAVSRMMWQPHLKDLTALTFRCKDELACKNARVKGFAKEHPEI